MASGKTLQSTIEISGVLSPSLQSAIKSAVDRLEEMSKETLDSVGAAAKLSAEMDAQETVLKNLRKGYADFVVDGQESSEEAQQLAAKITELSGDLSENEKILKAAENAADKLGDSMDDAGEDAESSSGGYTILKDVIADLTSDAIHAAVEAFKELAIESDTALSLLEARTGATAGELEGFEDVMYEVYNSNYGESLGDVSEKLSTVIQMTDDLDNASLAKVTKNVIALEDVFGFDTVESMRAVNSLMDQFGITSDQAFNLIVQGAQNGLNQNDDLLDTINEYSMQFQTAGYTADEMFNMLANGAESGTWSVDKLGDAVKEFNIRASDGTISDAIKENAKALGLTSTEAKNLSAEVKNGNVEAYQTVLEKLQEVDDSSKRYQLGVSMFGTMWEDLGEDAVLSLMNTEGGINSMNAAMDQMDAAAYDNLEGSLSQLGRTLEADVVQPLVEKFSPALQTAVDFLTANVKPTIEWIGDNLPTIGVALGGITAAVIAFKVASLSAKLATEGFTIATKAQAIAQKLLNGVMNANPIGLIILGITALVTAFMYLWDNCEGFRNFWIGLWEGIKSTVSVAFDWIQNVFSGAWEGIKLVWQTASTWFNETVIAPVKNFFTGMWAGLKNGAVSAWAGIKSTFSAVASFFGSIFSTAWAKVKAVFSAGGRVFDGIKEGIVSSFKTVVNAIITGINKVVKLPFEGLNKVISKIYGLEIAGINPFSWLTWRAPVPQIPLLASGGFTDGVSIAGEAGTEAVISFDPAYYERNVGIWRKAGEMLGVLGNEESSGGLTSKAGQLLTLDDFSLGSLADGTNVVIYYDFSNFTWSPHVEAGDGDDADDIMARLRAHEAEFFEWLEEFIKMREVAQYA